MSDICIHIPDEITNRLSLEESTLAAIAREALLVRLYAMGKIDKDSLTHALEIGDFEYVFLLKKYGITLPDTQATNGASPEPSPAYDENDPESLRERAREVLREAGLLTELGPELKQFIAEGPIITREEAQAIFARNPGKSLSEIVIEQRGPLY